MKHVTPHKAFCLIAALSGLMPALISAQAKAGQSDQSAQDNAGIHLYNPQKQSGENAGDTEGDRPEKTATQQRDAGFTPERFLKHPGRIHYEQKSGDTTTDADTSPDTRTPGQAPLPQAQTVTPPRKPESLTARVETVNVTPPQKPEAKGKTSPLETKTKTSEPKAKKSADTRAQTEDDVESPDQSQKASSGPEREKPQMPAVPPAQVKTDSLKERPLSRPSEDTGDSDESRAARDAQDPDKQDPDTQSADRQSPDTQDPDHADIADTRDNEHFLKAKGTESADYRLIFDTGMRQLNKTMQTRLGKHVIPAMQDNPDAKLVMKSYATAADSGQSSDRRIALARALKLRDFLISNDIASDRMNIRALGNASDTPPHDRIDLRIISP